MTTRTIQNTRLFSVEFKTALPPTPGKEPRVSPSTRPLCLSKTSFPRRSSTRLPGTSTPPCAPLSNRQRRLDVVEPDFPVAAGRPHGLEQHPAYDRGAGLGQAACIDLQPIVGSGRQARRTAPRRARRATDRPPGRAPPPGQWRAASTPPAARSSSGSTRWRIRLRGFVRSSFVSSSTHDLGRAIAGTARRSARATSSSGRMTAPRCGIDPAEPGQAGAAHQLQQERLGLVVLRVCPRRCGPRRSLAAARSRNVVAQPARGVFERQPLRRGVCADVDALDDDRQAEPRGKLAAELPRRARPSRRSRWLRCARPTTVKLAMLGQLEEQQRQRDRVGPAGQPDEHAAARRAQAVAADGAADLLVKCCQIPNPNVATPTPKRSRRRWELALGALGVGS